MINFKDTYATIWKVEDKGNYSKGRISTSEKDRRNDGEYINSNWFCKFVGNANKQVAGLPERTKIKILSGKVTNATTEINGEKKTFLDVVIFDFELVNGSTNSTKPTTTTVVEDDLPF